MADLRVIEAQPGHAYQLTADLRPADRAEIYAAHGPAADVQELVTYGVRVSAPHAWSMFRGDSLVLMGGVAPAGSLLGGEFGIPWVLGTTAMDRHPGALTRHVRRYLAQVRRVYPEMVNFVDARNTSSIRWLRRIGFTLDEAPEPRGPYGLPFYRFRMVT